MASCHYCGKDSDNLEPRWETDPHGTEMCDECADIQDVQWKMCVICNEYGLAKRSSDVWICVDCGDAPESLDEVRIASSAGEGHFEEIFGDQ